MLWIPILIAIVVAVWYLRIRQTNQILVADAERKWTTIGKPTHFMADPDLINLYYALVQWLEWYPSDNSEEHFRRSVSAANTVLGLRAKLTDGNCARVATIADDQARKAVNYLQTFMYLSSIDPLLRQELGRLLQLIYARLSADVEALKQDCRARAGARDKPSTSTIRAYHKDATLFDWY